MKKRRMRVFVMMLVILLLSTQVVFAKGVAKKELTYGTGSDETKAGFLGVITPGISIFRKDYAEVGAYIDADSPNYLRFARVFAFVYNKAGVCVTAYTYADMGVWESHSKGAIMSRLGAKAGTYRRMEIKGSICDHPGGRSLKSIDFEATR